MLFSDTETEFRVRLLQRTVLILVVMDAVLWHPKEFYYVHDYAVLILVVMDAVLWHGSKTGAVARKGMS